MRQRNPKSQGAKEGISRVSEVGGKFGPGPRRRGRSRQQWGWGKGGSPGAGRRAPLALVPPPKFNSAAAAQKEVSGATARPANQRQPRWRQRGRSLPRGWGRKGRAGAGPPNWGWQVPGACPGVCSGRCGAGGRDWFLSNTPKSRKLTFPRAGEGGTSPPQPAGPRAGAEEAPGPLRTGPSRPACIRRPPQGKGGKRGVGAARPPASASSCPRRAPARSAGGRTHGPEEQRSRPRGRLQRPWARCTERTRGAGLGHLYGERQARGGWRKGVASFRQLPSPPVKGWGAWKGSGNQGGPHMHSP